MLTNKTYGSRHAQAGVSLIELMISIALGLLLLGAATAMTVQSMVMNADTLGSARLNQNLDSVLQVMVNDIRRAGFSANVTAGAAGVDYANLEDLNIVSASCVLYAYNANGDGTKNENERFGFKQVGSAIQMRTTCPDSDGANCWTSCLDSVGTWVDLTDSGIVTISGLAFNSSNSKCLNITDKVFWVTRPSLTTTNFPCVETDSTKLDHYVVPYAPGGTFAVPDTGDRLVETRQVNVQIGGNLTNDNSTTKSQAVAINVRNNHMSEIP